MDSEFVCNTFKENVANGNIDVKKIGLFIDIVERTEKIKRMSLDLKDIITVVNEKLADDALSGISVIEGVRKFIRIRDQLMGVLESLRLLIVDMQVDIASYVCATDEWYESESEKWKKKCDEILGDSDIGLDY